MLLDILIRIRDQLGGLDRAKQSFRELNATVATSTKQWSQTIGSLLGVSASAALLSVEIRRVIQNIESIPNIPAETIQSINLAKQGFADARNQLDGWIASAAGAFTQIGQGLGYLVASQVYGADTVQDAFVAQAGAANDAQLAANAARIALQQQQEQARKLAQNLADAAQRANDLQAAMLQAADASGAEALVGESDGARAVRLREEAKLAEELATHLTGKPEGVKLQIQAAQQRTEARRIELQLTERLQAAEAAQQDREFARLGATKRLAVIDAEIAAIAEQTNAFRGGDAAATERQVQLEEHLNDLLSQRDATEREIADAKKRAEDERRHTIAAGPGRNDITGQVNDALERLPTLAESAGQAVQTAYGGIFNSISSGLDGLWNRTMSLGDALLSIAGGFRDAILRAIADMAAQYVAKKAVMFAIDVAYSAKSLALSVANAAKSLVAWIPSAIAAAISSFGTAAAIGTAAVIAAVAATGGFEDGGFTGGRDGAPAGIVHGQEFVFSAPAVRNLGAGNLASLHAAALSPAAAAGAGAIAGASGGGGERQAINLAIVDRMTSAEDFLESSRGQKILYDRFRQFQREVG